ncbi:MAG: NUDIX domain-containing protein [Desulfotalea sp.]
MKFHYLARALIQNKGKFLLARGIGLPNTFLPGGHIELGETAESAIAREITEEFGGKVSIQKFLGAVEHQWPQATKENHEINLIFLADLENADSNFPPKSLESHLEFLWVTPESLSSVDLQPYPLVRCIQDYVKTNECFWGSTMGDLV